MVIWHISFNVTVQCKITKLSVIIFQELKEYNSTTIADAPERRSKPANHRWKKAITQIYKRGSHILCS